MSSHYPDDAPSKCKLGHSCYTHRVSDDVTKLIYHCCQCDSEWTADIIQWPDYPNIGGCAITRKDIIDALRETYKNLLEREQEEDPTIRGYPDFEAVLNYIEEHGLPPKKQS
jgi:hypothetical protein